MPSIQQSNITLDDGQFGRGQGALYLLTFAIFAFVAPFLIRIPWQATSEIHTLFELTAILLAVVVAHLSLIYHRHSRRDAQFFFVAFGFLAAALLDAVHMLLTSSIFSLPLPSSLVEVTPWSWLVSRMVLAGFFLLNAATLSDRDAGQNSVRARMPQYVGFILVLAISALLVFLLVPVPQAIFLGLMIPRPQELAVVIPLALAFILYYRKRSQVQDPLFRWVLGSIVINLAIQLFYIPWSSQLFDAAFNWAHLLKIGSYFVVLFGLASSMTDIIDQLRGNRDEIRRQNAQLTAEIIERTKAETTIRMYQDIVDNMHSGVYVIQLEDPNDLGSFRFILGNRGAEIATGQPIEPVLNQRIDQAAPMLMETEFPAIYKKVLDSRQRLFMGDIYDPGDEERDEAYFEVWFIPLDERHLAAIFENTTERKRIERDLLTSKQELNEAQALAHIGSWSWQIATNRIAWSDELYRIYGYEPGGVVLDFERYISHIHPADRKMVQDTVAKALEDGVPFDYYHRIVTTAGDTRIIHARGYIEMAEDAGGAPQAIRMWGTGQDVTEQRLVEEARRRNEIRLGQALNLSLMGHWEWNQASDRVLISAELAPILGYGPEAVDLSFDEFMGIVHNEDRSRVAGAMRDAFSGASALHTQFRILHRDGSERGIDCIGTVVVDNQGKLTSVWGTCQDISERWRMESQIRQYATQLEASNRELQDFAYIASHDLQEPLRKISAFGDRVVHLNRERLDERSLDYLARMQDAANRMQTLINDLLTLSRITTRGRPFTNVDLNSLVAGVLRDLEQQIEKTKGRVEVEPLPSLSADRAQMQQLFQNLISNGLKFHRDDVPPVVRIFADKSDGTSTSEESHPSRHVTIVVEDNGIGFDTQYSGKIFQPFQRLHGRNTYEGTGMGLAITRKIMERHGGTIRTESEVGRGTRFILTLPLDAQGPVNENGTGGLEIGSLSAFDMLSTPEESTPAKTPG